MSLKATKMQLLVESYSTDQINLVYITVVLYIVFK